MAKLRMGATVELDVSVVIGRYTPGRPGFISGPPEDCYEAEPADVELEAVLLEGEGRVVDVLPYLPDAVVRDLKEQAFELCEDRAESDYIDQMVSREEARRDSEEDR